MEVQIQNLMPFPMCMSQVSFEPSSVCVSTNLNSFTNDSGLVIVCTHVCVCACVLILA